MRVVLDTNILISACWTPGGNEARVIAMAVGGALEIAVSDELEAEYRDVAGRKKFAKQREALEAAIDSLLAVASRRSAALCPPPTWWPCGQARCGGRWATASAVH